MIDEKKVRTKKGLNTYYIYEGEGEYILLSLEYPYEGCDPQESKLFKTIEAVEEYIDNNSPKFESFIVTYLNMSE